MVIARRYGVGRDWEPHGDNTNVLKEVTEI